MQTVSIGLVIGIVFPPFLTAFASLSGKSQSQRSSLLTFLASVISFCCSLALLLNFPKNGHYHLNFSVLFINIFIDALSVYFIFLINIVALFASYFTKFIMANDIEAQSEKEHWPNSLRLFHLEFNLFHCSMLLVPLVDNLLFLWVLIAFTTVISAPLIGYHRDRRAQEAAWKYIMISSSGIVFALLGTIFLLTVLKQNVDWSKIIHYLNQKNVVQGDLQGVVKIAFLLILLGYGTKAGLFPMHTWLPDGHGEAPSPVSALLSGVLLKCALYVILRFYVITNLALNEHDFASNMLLIFGLFSLLMATPFILNMKKENRFKRVLAYHSLEHMGIITFGFGLGIQVAFFGALYQALNHALTKALMFLAYGRVQETHANMGIPDEKIRGVFKIMPVTGCLLVLGGLALVGSPPFSIFFSEFTILFAAIQRVATNPLGIGVMIAAICAFLISIALIFAGLVTHLGRMMLGKSPIHAGKVREQSIPLLLLGILLVVLIWGGFTTNPLTNILQQSANIVYTGGF